MLAPTCRIMTATIYVHMRCTCAHICVYVSRVLRVYIHVYAYVSRHKDRLMYSHVYVWMDRHRVDIFHDIDLMIEGNDNIVLFDIGVLLSLIQMLIVVRNCEVPC